MTRGVVVVVMVEVGLNGCRGSNELVTGCFLPAYISERSPKVWFAFQNTPDIKH